MCDVRRTCSFHPLRDVDDVTPEARVAFSEENSTNAILQPATAPSVRGLDTARAERVSITHPLVVPRSASTGNRTVLTGSSDENKKYLRQQRRIHAPVRPSTPTRHHSHTRAALTSRRDCEALARVTQERRGGWLRPQHSACRSPVRATRIHRTLPAQGTAVHSG